MTLKQKLALIVERWCERRIRCETHRRTQPMLASSYGNEAEGLRIALELMGERVPTMKSHVGERVGWGRDAMVQEGRVRVRGPISWEDVGELSAYFEL